MVINFGAKKKGKYTNILILMYVLVIIDIHIFYVAVWIILTFQLLSKGYRKCVRVSEIKGEIEGEERVSKRRDKR